MPFELLEKPRHIQAWDRFLEIGLPNQHTEVYRYVRLKELYSGSFASPKRFESSIQPLESTLVFTNGEFQASLSKPPQGLIVSPLSQAFDVYGSFLTARIQKSLKQEKDPFAALNGAYYQEGLFLYLPPKCVCHTPVRIIHYVDHNETLVCPRIHLFMGKGSSMQLTWEQEGLLDATLVNTYIDCALEEAAALEIIQLSHLPRAAHSFWNVRATLKQHSSLKSFSVTNGSATSREDYVVHCLGQQAQAHLYGVWSLKEQRQHHVNIWMDHQEPGCTTLQKFKGTLSDTSRSSFEGKIYVHSKAQKTEAYQMNNNLVLGKRASAHSKPNLEIFADDVRASHGATIGQIDAEHLFYLQARGIPLSTAQAILIKGFSQEIIDLIPHQRMRERASHLL